ncbi:MAG: TlpA family protein disulfide reductase [Hyphomonadaceae bacterium]|jgi:thiol-disulfide isomerase/thioredoxin|nr:TlpA family protein disulfide reductase [Hyphomonadaceae bacterium]
MTETRDNTGPTPQETPEPRTSSRLDLNRLRGRAIQIMALVAIGAFLSVIFTAATNQQGGSTLDRFDRASLALIEFIPDPPPMPDTPFKDVNGAAVSLKDFRGKTVLVNLWATWCAPCVKEMPTLAELQRTYASEDFVVVAISVDKDDTRDAAVTQLADLGAGALAFYHEPSLNITYDLKARGFPTSILYGPDGVEIARLAGEADWASPEAKGLIRAVLDGER